MASSQQGEESIFKAARAMADADTRRQFLDQACSGDPALRERVVALLAEQEKLGSFLEVPAANVATIERPAGAERLGMRIGPYKLLQKLGEGGMGTVYLAEQEQPVKRHVALKIIKAGMDSALVIARFEQERQALAIMDHPHIAKVLDAGTTDNGRPYFVMELVKGIPITRYCDQEHLTLKERLELFIPVCQAVQHAHQKGIIHRDLKPSNVLIALYDGQPVPKVIDFGVAKATSHKLTERTLFTEVGSIVGTLEYMAPEQAELNNLDIDTRADIYSLGVLLYELLTGATPFGNKQLRSAGFNEMLRIIKEVEPQKPSTRLSSSAELPSIAANRKLEPKRLTRLVQGDLDWIVMKCLEKERARRYETANDFAMDIQRYLTDEPVLAGAPSAGYRLRKFLRRNKGPVLAAALVLLTLLGGIVGTTWGLIRAEKSRQAEGEQRKLAETARQRETARAEAEAQQRQRAEAAEAAAKTNEKQANAERDRAEQEKQIALAVKDFLRNRLLGQANAYRQADAILQSGVTAEIKENPTVRELLDRAAAEVTTDKIDSRFPKMPFVQAEILKTIGLAYLSVGEYRTAVTHLKRSHDVYLRERGPDNHETLTALHNLALAYLDAGQLSEAIQAYEQVREKEISTLGAGHPSTITTLNNLAQAYMKAGRSREAIPLFEQVRDRRTEQLGADDMATFGAQRGLAEAYLNTGRTSDAIQLYEQIRDKQLQMLGTDHPNTLATLQSLAGAHRIAGKLPEAIQLYEQVRDKATKTFGADHPKTMTTLNSLALAYLDAKRLPEAIQIYETLRDKEDAKLGPDHPSTLTTLHNLALAYTDARRVPEAIQLFEQVRDRRIEKLGPNHPATLTTLSNLGRAYQTAGRLPEAIQLYVQVREKEIEKLGPDHPSTLNTMNRLAVAYRAAGKLHEAL